MAVSPLHPSSQSSTPHPLGSYTTEKIAAKVIRAVEQHIQKLKTNISNSSKDLEHFFCPITLEVFKEPVMDEDGHTFEKKAIEKHLETSTLCPINRKPIHMLTPNRVVQQFIEERQKKDPIPTFSLFKKSLPQLAQKNLLLVQDHIRAKEYEAALITYSNALQYTRNCADYQKLPLLYDKMEKKDHAILSYLYLLRYQLEDKQISRAIKTLQACNSKYPSALEAISKEMKKFASFRQNLINGVYASYFLENKKWPTAIASNDEKLFSASDDNIISIWDLTKGSCIATLHSAVPKDQIDDIRSLVLKDEIVFSGAKNGMINSWDLTTGTPMKPLWHSNSVSSLLTIEDMLISGSEEGTIKIWNLKTSPPTFVAALLKHEDKISSLAAFNGKLISGSRDATIRIWDLNTDLLQKSDPIVAHRSGVESLAVNNEKLFSGSIDGEIMIWDLNTKPISCTKSWKAHSGAVSYLLIADGVLVSASCADKEIKIWDLHTKTPTCTATLEESIYSLAYADDKLIASTATGDIKIWDFAADHSTILKEIAALYESFNVRDVEAARDRFARLPESEKYEINCIFFELDKSKSKEKDKKDPDRTNTKQLASNLRRAEAIKIYLEKIDKDKTAS